MPRHPLVSDGPESLGRRGVFRGRIDGGARGNPGPAGIGVVLEGPAGEREEYFAFLGSSTNNVAEYAALLVLLEQTLNRGGAELVVHSDSQLLVRQMQGTYKVKNPRLKMFHAQARRLLARIRKVTFHHVPREENQDADRLANRAMDEQCSSGPLPEAVTRLMQTPTQGVLSLGEQG